jgi:hypothetical protein
MALPLSLSLEHDLELQQSLQRFAVATVLGVVIFSLCFIMHMARSGWVHTPEQARAERARARALRRTAGGAREEAQRIRPPRTSSAAAARARLISELPHEMAANVRSRAHHRPGQSET